MERGEREREEGGMIETTSQGGKKLTYFVRLLSNANGRTEFLQRCERTSLFV